MERDEHDLERPESGVLEPFADVVRVPFDAVREVADTWKIYEARRLRAEHAESLNEEATEALDRVIEALEFFGPAREHFKTLYFEWELTNLSRVMLYAAVPALIVSMAGVLYLGDPGTVTGITLGVDTIVLAVSVATAGGSSRSRSCSRTCSGSPRSRSAHSRSARSCSGKPNGATTSSGISRGSPVRAASPRAPRRGARGTHRRRRHVPRVPVGRGPRRSLPRPRRRRR